MTPEQFCYWLQGFAEITSGVNLTPTPEQWKIINDHLQAVFKKVTLDRSSSSFLESLKKIQNEKIEREGWPEKRDPWKVTCSAGRG